MLLGLGTPQSSMASIAEEIKPNLCAYLTPREFTINEMIAPLTQGNCETLSNKPLDRTIGNRLWLYYSADQFNDFAARNKLTREACCY
jgi:hypothetical protein